MTHILVRHKVSDYATWKPAFDAHAEARKAAGSRGGQVFSSASDPNEVIVLLTWADLESAHRFADSAELRQAMERAGVVDRPDVYYLDESDRPVA
ncbi:MAG: cyclase [Betaproteobacteria bacterium]|nr:cyclase [Betaproteobacteria bacterium]